MLFYAMTSAGLEDALVQEFEEIGLKNIKKSFLGVYFEGNMQDCMKANICSRIATRILLSLTSFTARDPEELYKNVYEIPFEEFITKDQTFKIHSTVWGRSFTDQRYVAMKSKDAIADRFTANFGSRPNVEKDDPDLIINVRVVDDRVDVALDTSGDSLSLRGYRETTVMAPLREHLAAGLLRYAGYKGTTNVVDPMCGSGTFLIEAAMIALNQYPGLNKKKFQFEKLKEFNQDEWDELTQKYLDLEKQETDLRFFGYDIDREATKAAKSNVHKAGLQDFITVNRSGVDVLTPPCESGILIVNPPYGERLGDDENLKDVYRDLGYSLKTNFKGWECWIISGHKELVQLLGLKSTLRIPVYNGPIDCRFLKYEIRA
jgi:23S rRNA G2445 N2-methylase RlmL